MKLIMENWRSYLQEKAPNCSPEERYRLEGVVVDIQNKLKKAKEALEKLKNYPLPVQAQARKANKFENLKNKIKNLNAKLRNARRDLHSTCPPPVEYPSAPPVEYPSDDARYKADDQGCDAHARLMGACDKDKEYED